MKILICFILIVNLIIIVTSVYKDFKNNAQKVSDNKLHSSYGNKKLRYFNNKQNEEKNIKTRQRNDNSFPFSSDGLIKINKFDPVLDFVKKKRVPHYRKAYASSDSSSSSRELPHWKDEWKEIWLEKKIEALNSTVLPGDTVNMLAARPWGVPCGDPNQHDMPWGTCTLPMECDPEYRIYRGDYFCGRTEFVCCSIEMITYDMYQGFDVSFGESSLSTGSEEERDRERGSRENRKRKKARERRKRRREREKRKRAIKKNIRKIVRQIRKILTRVYRNGTTERKRKTKMLKKFVEELKKQYKQDRQSVRDVHEIEMVKIDANLQKKLREIRAVNENFIKNATFRDIVTNGTINKKGARMLLQAYPELSPYFDSTRRHGSVKPKDYIEYDVEYGMVYDDD